MKHILAHWLAIENDLKKQDIFLFLDYDGTLTPIVDHPNKAKFKPASRQLLKTLSTVKRVTIAVISGRELIEVKKLVAVPGIIYAGNHGLEAEGPGFRFVHEAASQSEDRVRKMVNYLRLEVFSTNENVFVEGKRFSLSVHYRLVPDEMCARVSKIFHDAIAPYLAKKQFVLKQGKKVWELRPPVDWDKGSITERLLAYVAKKKKKKSIVPIYIGDDVTDEDAFRALGNGAVTIRVTSDPKQRSLAKWYLRSSAEVESFLSEIVRCFKRP